MTNFSQPGDVISYQNGGSALASGAVVARVTGASGCLGVATDAIAANAVGELAVTGVFTLTKLGAATGRAFTDGQAIFWDVSNSRLTNASTGNTRAGRAVGAATTTSTTAKVAINVY